uniref:Uncharacterized protein n=1 Tax=Sphaerodactylus townsendi TaxID=933632 RepID=A0ACB8F061_9SAUR
MFSCIVLGVELDDLCGPFQLYFSKGKGARSVLKSPTLTLPFCAAPQYPPPWDQERSRSTCFTPSQTTCPLARRSLNLHKAFCIRYPLGPLSSSLQVTLSH